MGVPEASKSSRQRTPEQRENDPGGISLKTQFKNFVLKEFR